MEYQLLSSDVENNPIVKDRSIFSGVIGVVYMFKSVITKIDNRQKAKIVLLNLIKVTVSLFKNALILDQ